MAGKTEKWSVITGHWPLFTALKIYQSFLFSLLCMLLLFTLLAYTRPLFISDKIYFNQFSLVLVLTVGRA